METTIYKHGMNRATEVMAAGLTWRVFNKTASRRYAKARCLSFGHTGLDLQIGNSQEVLDLGDTNDIQCRIETAMEA